MLDFDLRVRRYDAGGAAREIMQHQALDFTTPLGDVAAATLTVSTAVVGPLPDVLEFAVELWDGASWTEPANCRYIADKTSYDALDVAGIVQVTGINAVSWLLAKSNLASVTGGPRRWTDTVGLIILSLVDEAQARGALAAIEYSFDSLNDSAGEPWNAAGRVDLEFQAGQSTWQIIQAMADQNVIEFQTNGRTLHIFNPGTGDDRSTAGSGQARLGITSTSIPVSTSIGTLSTHVTVRGDEFAWVFPVDGATPTGYGRLESTLEAGGVIDGTTAGIFAAPATKTHGAPRSQYVVTEALAAAVSHPLVPGGYQLGDWVSVRRASGFEKMRVMALQIRHDGVTATADITLADRLETLEARLAKRSAGLGGALGGNGRFSGHGGGGSGGGSGVFVTIADEYHIGALVKVILDGSLEPTAEGWKYLDSYRPVKGERVFAVPGPGPGGYVIVGRAIGAEYTAPGNAEIGELAPTWQTYMPDRYGDVTVVKTETEWVLSSGMVIAPGKTEAGIDPETGEEIPADDGRTVMQLAGIYRPVMDVEVGWFTIDTDGYVRLNFTTSKGRVISLASIIFNASKTGLTPYGFDRRAAWGVDALGIAYGLGATSSDSRSFGVPAALVPEIFTRIHSVTIDTAGIGLRDNTGYSSGYRYDGLRWVTAAKAGDFTWSTLDLINGFVHDDPASEDDDGKGPVEYVLRTDGTVLLRGGALGIAAPELVVGILPEGFRPTFEWDAGNYSIRANGEIVSSIGSVSFGCNMHLATH
ncbi:hypothetical protein [Cryobacterium sp. PH31-O1]|uniref:hypothetical protein n=1 Tax=Cryobacterium sp. PH31-O1 TaxID=3046306 RepID=UPI0024B89E94|nr:hypothetical protein [Cryobacterium sp. PH31-O1]MDJ0338269.1 hypothetical protein [Cryobacterium sp. PH31-O1]